MIPFWASVSERLDNFASKPDRYLFAQPTVAEEIKSFTKQLYDSAKNSEKNVPAAAEALPELIIANFDDEQIWQQLELQNSDLYDNLLKKVSRLMAKESTAKVLRKIESSQPQGEEEEEIENVADDVEQQEKGKGARKNKKSKILKPSVVDDKFFKLQEMEEFLLDQEKDGKGEPDGEEIDFFADDLESDEEEEGDGVQYKDFFDAPEGEEIGAEAGHVDDFSNGEEEEIDDEESGDEGGADEIGDEESEDEIGDEEVEDEMESDLEKEEIKEQSPKKKDLLVSEESGSEEEEEGPKSSFEMRQGRLKKKIEQIHEEALGEKPWQLHGEISASTRPQNSLLEEILQFDRTQRPAPVITEQTTIKLEDIIRQRIKDKAWDDVERKIKPVEEAVEYKKKLTLDQSKSKMSLAEIYEQDYLKQKKEANQDPNEEEEEEEKDTPEKIEIKNMLHSLFTKLDALSNYHYTPRPSGPDVKVVSNIPAICVEEVAPAATSDATLLAPEEIKGKLKGNPLSKEERNDTDKSRERRKKKAKQRANKIKREAKEAQGGGAKAAVKKAIKEGRVKELDVVDKKAVKSSTAFFNKLQDEVSNTISLKKQEMKRKKNEISRISAKKLKL